MLRSSKILRNISKRGSDKVREEMSLHEPSVIGYNDSEIVEEAEMGLFNARTNSSFRNPLKFLLCFFSSPHSSKQNDNWCLFSRNNGISKDKESDKSEGHSENTWIQGWLGRGSLRGIGAEVGGGMKQKRKVRSRFRGLWA